jgi:hypothetical protein
VDRDKDEATSENASDEAKDKMKKKQIVRVFAQACEPSLVYALFASFSMLIFLFLSAVFAIGMHTLSRTNAHKK